MTCLVARGKATDWLWEDTTRNTVQPRERVRNVTTKITRKEILQYLAGELDDSDKIEQVYFVLETNPKLSSLVSSLGGDDYLEVDEEYPKQPEQIATLRQLGDQLTHSELWAITSGPSQNSGKCRILGQRQGQAVILNAEWKKLASTEDSYALIADFPQGLLPIGLIAGKLFGEAADFVRVPIPGAEVSGAAGPLALAARSKKSSQATAASLAESQKSAAIEWTSRAPDRVHVSAALPERQDNREFVLLLDYPAKVGESAVGQYVKLNRDVNRSDAVAEAKNFPWPSDPSSAVGTLSLYEIAGLQNKSWTARPFAAIPITPGDLGWQGEFCFPDQLAALNDPDACWYVRLANAVKETE